MDGNGLDLKINNNGLITYYDSGTALFYGMDSTFSVVDTFYCKNGYYTDVHELVFLNNGHYLLIGDDYEYVDMSQIVPGGNTNALVLGIVIQELDQNKNVVFQWRSFDHFKITDATSDINLTAGEIDYAHTNAIEIDADSNIIISNRNMDEITKINRTTGDIIWRWGGKNNQFTFVNDNIGFSHQHAIRRIANGDYTLFDDGNLHFSIMSSRALEYNLDQVNKIASLVWQFKNTPDEYSTFMGYVQRLDNGNTLIGWGGGNPSATEITPAGNKVLELNLPQSIYSYRAYRFNLNKSYLSPFVVKLKYPANGFNFSGDSINLIWNKNKFAQTFRLQIATDSMFQNPVLDISSITDTSIIVNMSSNKSNYYWHVQSDNNSNDVGGYSGFSETWKFTNSVITQVKNSNIPTSYSLSQNYPNPFNPSTVINYEIPKTSHGKLNIYDILGREVANLVNETKPAGYYSIVYNARNLTSGVYFYRVQADNFTSVKKMILIK